MNSNIRVAVVTGGTQGIGRRTAELLAERGYKVAIIDLHQPSETLKAIEASGGEAIGYSDDIADESTVNCCAHELFAHYGRADMLVINAGISLISAAENTSLSDYRRGERYGNRVSFGTAGSSSLCDATVQNRSVGEVV